MKWISVEDRLPKKFKGYYLTLTIEKKKGIALWKYGKWWSDEYQDEKLVMGIKDEFITHWTPLPDPPNPNT